MRSRRTCSRASSRCGSTPPRSRPTSSAACSRDRGAEPLLPLAAPADRNGARARCAQGELAAGRRRLTVLVIVTVWSGKFEVGPAYFEAPGLAILTLVNRDFHWDVNAFHWLLGVAAARIGRPARAASPPRRGRSGRRACGSVAPDRPDLRDDRKHRRRPTELREEDPGAAELGRPADGRRARHVPRSVGDRREPAVADGVLEPLARATSASLNGVAPGPGPISAPGLETTDGALSGYTGDRYTLAGNGVQLAAPIVAQRGRLHALPDADALAPAERGAERLRGRVGDEPDRLHVLPARWARDGRRVALAHRRTTGPGSRRRRRSGSARSSSTRTACPSSTACSTVRHALVRNGKRTVVRTHVASTPVTVTVTMPTFSTPTDSRLLAAQPSFRFVPDRP